MGQAFLVRRGGGSSNENGIKTMTVPDAGSLPATGDESTIAIVTGETIGRVYVQNALPETGEAGTVCILTGGAGKQITIAGTATIVIDIAGVYIRQEAEWACVDAYLYQDGEWALIWSGQLYDRGNEYEEITGGWTTKALVAASNSTASPKAPTVTRGEESICAEVVSGGGIFYPANMIDLTPYKSLVFEGTFERSGTVARNFAVCVWSKIGSYYTANVLAYQYMEGATGSRLVLDVSGIKESGYIGLGLTHSKAIISRCYLIAEGM